MNSDSDCEKIQMLCGTFLKSTATGDVDSSEKIISLIDEQDSKHFIELFLTYKFNRKWPHYSRTLN